MLSAVMAPVRLRVWPLATLMMASLAPAAAEGLKATVDEIVGLLAAAIKPPLAMEMAPPVMLWSTRKALALSV